MEVRRYRPEDFEQVREWGEQWGEKYEASQFPATGFIVPEVAAFFIYSTDSSVCWLENMVSSKRALPDDREQALRLIVDACLHEAAKMNCSVAYASTQIPEVIARAVVNGAHAEPHQTLLKRYFPKNKTQIKE